MPNSVVEVIAERKRQDRLASVFHASWHILNNSHNVFTSEWQADDRCNEICETEAIEDCGVKPDGVSVLLCRPVLLKESNDKTNGN